MEIIIAISLVVIAISEVLVVIKIERAYQLNCDIFRHQKSVDAFHRQNKLDELDLRYGVVDDTKKYLRDLMAKRILDKVKIELTEECE